MGLVSHGIQVLALPALRLGRALGPPIGGLASPSFLGVRSLRSVPSTPYRTLIVMPRKHPRSTRSYDTHVRLTEAEYQRASELAAAARCSISKVLRAGLSKQQSIKPAPPVVPVFDQQAVREIRRIGVNLNQLTRELYRHDRQSVTIPEIHKLDTELMRLIALVYLGKDAAQQLLAERFATWFSTVKLPHEPNQPA